MIHRLGLDTNVLIYAWLEAHSRKGELARELLKSSSDKVLPLQVAAEPLPSLAGSVRT
jgi:predicted nucleic acid-binding protein